MAGGWIVAPGSPWENGYVKSFNARLRDWNVSIPIRRSARQRCGSHQFPRTRPI